jgi:prevent-host-death family protein
MSTVGIKMLKENLSEYVAMARSGERVIITDRGEEVAEIGPLSPERLAMKRLMAAGKVKWSGRKPQVGDAPVNRGAAASDAVIEDRR